MGKYIVQAHQYAHKSPDKLDDGQAFHEILERGDEVELDDDHHHTQTLVKQGVVISQKAHEQQRQAAQNVGELDSNVAYDREANDSKNADAGKASSSGSGNGGSAKG